MDTVPMLLTVEDVCGWLRIPKSTLYKLCKERKIPSIKVGKHWRFDRAHVERWLAELPGTTSSSESTLRKD
jgi:excisionase family DNA binding protein